MFEGESPKGKGFSMIYIFRKEMKKWHTVLWVVFAALALGSGFSIMRYKSPSDGIGNVNGEKITFGEFRRALGEINARLNMLRPYAKVYGLSEEALIRDVLGMGSPEDVAIDTCVREKLIDQVVSDFNVSIATGVFKEELVRSMPDGVTDQQGYINMDVYQNYLTRLSMTPLEFEENKGNELKREVVQRFMGNAFYLPQFAVRDAYEVNNLKKSFVVVHLPFNRFLQESEKESVDEKALKEYYEANKEVYRTPERRKLRYWSISPDDYAQKVVVDDETIKNFYERNKTALYRISPKIKVRRIVCALQKGKPGTEAHVKAQKVLQEAKSTPNNFAELAKKYSDDVTAKSGGVVDFFGRGTHDKAFEDAAFKLNAPGELSSVIKTSKGFEIIQLVERKKAEEKPLELVKDEIVKSLRMKKAVSSLRADLEIMVHNARADVGALEAFVKQHQFEEKESDWLTTADGGKSDIKGMLAQKIFASVKKQQTYGYFMLENKYIIYLLAGTEKSAIPSLEQIKGAVVSDYREHQTESNMRKVVLQMKTDVFTKKMPLAAVAEKYNVKITKTGLISYSEAAVEGIEKENQLTHKLFNLSDVSQVLQHHHKRDYYLAQLIESAPFTAQEFEKEKNSIAKNLKMSGNRMYAGAFIASLQRTAKIEVDKKMITKTMSARD